MNWKIWNLAFWIEIILSYFLPFKTIEESQYQVGFPMPFLSVSAGGFRVSPFMSMHLNPVGLLLDGIFIYLLIIFCIKIYQKINPKIKNRAHNKVNKNCTGMKAD